MYSTSFEPARRAEMPDGWLNIAVPPIPSEKPGAPLAAKPHTSFSDAQSTRAQEILWLVVLGQH